MACLMYFPLFLSIFHKRYMSVSVHLLTLYMCVYVVHFFSNSKWNNYCWK